MTIQRRYEHIPTYPELELARILRQIVTAGASTERLCDYAKHIGDAALLVAMKTTRAHLLEAGAEVELQHARKDL